MAQLHKLNQTNILIEKLQASSPEIIAIQAQVRPKRDWLEKMLGSIKTEETGRLGLWEHVLRYSAINPEESKTFVEPLFTEYHTEKSAYDKQLRVNRVISLFLAAEVRLEYIQSEFPDTECYIAGQRPNEPVDSETWQLIYDVAAKHNVVSALTQVQPS